MTTIEIVPTVVAQSESDLEKSSKIAEFSSWIHVDVDDGIFAPVLSWPYVKKGIYGAFDLSTIGNMHIEAHLMVERPRKIGLAFAAAGAKRIIGHAEAFDSATEAHGALDLWRTHGAEAGLSILADTPLPVLEPLIPACDFVQVMSIATIGLQGAPFDARAIGRIAKLHEKFSELLISVDGGVSAANIAELVHAGARRFSVGSAIAKAENPEEAYTALKIAAEAAVQ